MLENVRVYFDAVTMPIRPSLIERKCNIKIASGMYNSNAGCVLLSSLISMILTFMLVAVFNSLNVNDFYKSLLVVFDIFLIVFFSLLLIYAIFPIKMKDRIKILKHGLYRISDKNLIRKIFKEDDYYDMLITGVDMSKYVNTEIRKIINIRGFIFYSYEDYTLYFSDSNDAMLLRLKL